MNMFFKMFLKVYTELAERTYIRRLFQCIVLYMNDDVGCML